MKQSKFVFARRERVRHSGPPCPHYPDKFKTESAHQAKLASRRRAHQRKKGNVNYRLRALLRSIVQRCSDPRHATYRWYGAKGVRTNLTLKQLKQAWIRDGAASMHKASIDRIDNDGHYEFTNIRFIELSENQKRGWANKAERTKAIRSGMDCAAQARFEQEKVA